MHEYPGPSSSKEVREQWKEVAVSCHLSAEVKGILAESDPSVLLHFLKKLVSDPICFQIYNSGE